MPRGDEGLKTRLDQLLSDHDRAVFAELVEKRLVPVERLVELARAKRERPDRPIAPLLRAEGLTDDETIETLVNGMEARARASVRETTRLLRLGNADLAAFRANESLAVKPSEVAALLARAEARERVGDSAGAKADLDRAVELHTGEARTWRARGRWHGRGGRHAEALADLSRAIELGPSAEAFLDRGLVYLAAGERLTALLDFARALELDPDSARARAARGVAYLGVGDEERGRADLLAVLKGRAPGKTAEGGESRRPHPQMPSELADGARQTVALKGPRRAWIATAAGLLAAAFLGWMLLGRTRSDPIPDDRCGNPARVATGRWTRTPTDNPPAIARETLAATPAPSVETARPTAETLASSDYEAFLVRELGLSPRDAAAEVAHSRRLLASLHANMERGR